MCTLVRSNKHPFFYMDMKLFLNDREQKLLDEKPRELAIFLIRLFRHLEEFEALRKEGMLLRETKKETKAREKSERKAIKHRLELMEA